MPIFEYKCNDCKACFESYLSSYRKIDDITCLNCNSLQISQLQTSVFEAIGGCGSGGGCGNGGCGNGGCSKGCGKKLIK